METLMSEGSAQVLHPFSCLITSPVAGETPYQILVTRFCAIELLLGIAPRTLFVF